ncbi:unnamed protein product, partial [Lymnaea stagnalis]
LYPNFSRVIASDAYMVTAIVDFLTKLDLNYVSVMFDNTHESTRLYHRLKDGLNLTQICVGKKLMINEKTNLARMLRDLLKDKLASRIIIVMGGKRLTELVMSTVSKTDLEGQFLWVGNDYWEEYIYKNLAPRGSIGVHFKRPSNQTDFHAYLQRLDIKDANPWLVRALETKDRCKDKKCLQQRIAISLKNPHAVLALMKDCPYVLANVLSKFLKYRCPRMVGSLALECFNRISEDFKLYMNHINAKEDIRSFKLNPQNSNEMFSVVQSAYDISNKPFELAQFSMKQNTTLVLRQFSLSQLKIPFERLRPESFCWKACAAGEYQYARSRWCWSCRRCQDNELVSDNLKSCVLCPPFYWPHTSGENKMHCRKIQVDRFHWFYRTAAMFLAASLLGSVSVLLILLLYCKKRSQPIIKASSVEISVIQLLLIALGYGTVPMFMENPSSLRCTLGLFFYMTSFDLLYATMLIKAIRVYRIF